MNSETRRCQWCGEITINECGCDAEIEIDRLRAAIASMRPMLDKRRIAWKKHSDYLDAVLGHNVQIEGRAAFGASLSNAVLGFKYLRKTAPFISPPIAPARNNHRII